MKIAILSPFYPYRGGIAQFSDMLYHSLVKEHEVKAFTFIRQYPDFLFPGKTQYTVEPDQEQVIPALRILDSIGIASYFKTARAILKFEPDMVIFAYWMSFFAVAYATVARLLKKKTKVVALLHNALPYEPHFLDRPLAKLFFNQCDRFVVMSEVVKHDLLSLKPNAEYTMQAHPIYDHFGKKIAASVAKERLKLDAGKRTLLFFGLIRDYKGLDNLIATMSFLDDSYQLVIAGEPYEPFDKYQKLIDISPARDRIQTHIRYIDNQDVPVLFSAADVLVLPYKSATQSGVIPIAYHFETPVVTTNVGGLRKTVEEAHIGVVCQPNPTALARGIEQIFSEKLETFVENLKEEKKKLSWDNFAKVFS